MSRLRLLACLGVLCAIAPPALGQAPAGQVPGFTTTKQFKLERLDEDHWRATGQVEMEKEDVHFFADQVDYYPNRHRVEAMGNVVYVSKDSRIAADRMEFDTQTQLGTFHEAAGTVTLTETKDRTMFGNQEPEAFFYGELLEKIGPKKYRIKKGGFTTCVQPSPRWEVTASSLSVTLDDYAIIHNAVIKVKDVPVFYLPIFYYPVQDDDRATGFLIPTYGSSTIRGHSLSNAFFWAMSRSMDATFMHDWFSKTGQGYGGEYRYIAGPGSDGNARVYFLNENETTYTDSLGNVQTQPARRSYDIRGRMSQRLPANLRARADVDYFSDVTVQQLYQTNLYQASLRQRSFGGNVSGSWGAYNASGTINLRQLFSGASNDDSTVYGNAPRFAFQRAPRRPFGGPVYFSLGSEFVRQVRTTKQAGEPDLELGLSRIDISPQVRLPLSQWPFLSVNASLTWRNTMYSDSNQQDIAGNWQRVPQWLYRNYFDMRAEVTGPTFTKIFNTDNGFAEKMKHVIEPTFAVQRTTAISNYLNIIKLDSYDYVLGDTTKLTYGLTNRVLAKRRNAPKQSAVREFISVGVSQSYYSDPAASLVDPSYSSSFQVRKPKAFSPWLLTARVVPTDSIDGGLRLEYDQEDGQLLTIGASGRFAFRDAFQATSGWSRRHINITRTDNYLNFGTSAKASAGRIVGFFGFDYDLEQDRFLQRRFQASYNAQCCGIAVEYQTYNFPVFDPRFPPRDRRFNITFTLAGIGTFSNLLGAFGNPSTGASR